MSALITPLWVFEESLTTDSPIGEAAPNRIAQRIWQTFDATRTPQLVATRRQREQVMGWLRREGFVAAGVLLGDTPEEWVDEARRNRRPTLLGVTSSPSTAATFHEKGLETLLLVSPKYARADYRPDYRRYEHTPWEALMETIDAERSVDIDPADLDENFGIVEATQ